jgi:hypothetical protein
VSAALDPNVMHLLTYAVIAVLVIFSFVGAILLVLGKVRTWVDDMVHQRMESLEKRDVERAEAVRRCYSQIAAVDARLTARMDDLFRLLHDTSKRAP